MPHPTSAPRNRDVGSAHRLRTSVVGQTVRSSFLFSVHLGSIAMNNHMQAMQAGRIPSFLFPFSPKPPANHRLIRRAFGVWPAVSQLAQQSCTEGTSYHALNAAVWNSKSDPQGCLLATVPVTKRTFIRWGSPTLSCRSGLGVDASSHFHFGHCRSIISKASDVSCLDWTATLYDQAVFSNNHSATQWPPTPHNSAWGAHCKTSCTSSNSTLRIQKM